MKFYLDYNYFFITSRTLDQGKYFAEDYQKQIVLDKILEIFKLFNINLDAYGILSNHYHLLFYLLKGVDLKKVMKMVNGGISFQLNKQDKVKRNIWDGYHISNVFDEESFYRVLGYIIGNPFKHGLVKSIDDLGSYKFCNYNEKVKVYGKEGINEIICNVKNLNWELGLEKNVKL